MSGFPPPKVISAMMRAATADAEKLVSTVIRASGGNIQAAAKALGLQRRMLSDYVQARPELMRLRFDARFDAAEARRLDRLRRKGHD